MITFSEVLIVLIVCLLFAGESGRAQQNGHLTGQFSSIHVALLSEYPWFEITVLAEGKVEQPDKPFCIGDKSY